MEDLVLPNIKMSKLLEMVLQYALDLQAKHEQLEDAHKQLQQLARDRYDKIVQLERELAGNYPCDCEGCT